MIVCVCEGVSDREVRAACHKGASSVEAVARTCGAGGKCGSCQKHIEQILAEQHKPERNLLRASVLPILVIGG